MDSKEPEEQKRTEKVLFLRFPNAQPLSLVPGKFFKQILKKH